MGHSIETVQRVIDAPAAQIFALLADASRHQEFDGSGTVRDAVGEPEPLAMGSRFGMSMHAGLPYRMVNTVVEYEPDALIAWQTRPDYPLANKLIGGRIWRYELQPANGGTLVRESWDISREVFPFLLRPLASITRKNMTTTLERLDALVTEGS